MPVPLSGQTLTAVDIRVHESGTVDAAWNRLDESPASLLIVELTDGNAAALVERLFDLARTRPRARVVVVAGRAFRCYRTLMMEAGAVHFTTNPRRLAPLIDVACRHLATAPVERPAAFPDRIWAALPWHP